MSADSLVFEDYRQGFYPELMTLMNEIKAIYENELRLLRKVFRYGLRFVTKEVASLLIYYSTYRWRL
jgi:hypothetical protein